jgi:GTP pyrophosphokinase
MHQRAEFGVAAHFAYKHGSPTDELAWLNRIVDWQSETSDPAQFMETLKVDLDQDEVYVFTPKGKVVTMAKGATPIDFAYAVHTEIGHACVGARINGRLVSLNHQLNSGDSCEIFTSKVAGTGPSRDWLQIVQTPRAANKIRQWFSRERREDARENGRDEVVKQLRREGLPTEKLPPKVLEEVAVGFHLPDVDALYTAVGEHHLSAAAVVGRISKVIRPGDPNREEQMSRGVGRGDEDRNATRPSAGVHVEGLDDVLVKLSRCCRPVPGDEIIGFVTRGRGVSVHRADCANAVSLQEGQADRLIDVEWDEDYSGGNFVASIEVKAIDREFLLADVAGALSKAHVNILTCQLVAGGDQNVAMRFEFELGDPSHLGTVLGTIRALDHVFDVFRVLPGAAALTAPAG